MTVTFGARLIVERGLPPPAALTEFPKDEAPKPALGKVTYEAFQRAKMEG